MTAADAAATALYLSGKRSAEQQIAALKADAERLHEALRRVAVATGHCELCNWDDDEHAPGCLAARAAKPD